MKAASDDHNPRGEQLSFLPPLEFTPICPTKNTLEDYALAMLAKGHPFNHPEFETKHQSWRLAAVVFNLRRLGWPIETTLTPRLCADGKRKNVARYRLPTKYITIAAAVVANRRMAANPL